MESWKLKFGTISINKNFTLSNQNVAIYFWPLKVNIYDLYASKIPKSANFFIQKVAQLKIWIHVLKKKICQIQHRTITKEKNAHIVVNWIFCLYWDLKIECHEISIENKIFQKYSRKSVEKKWISYDLNVKKK